MSRRHHARFGSIAWGGIIALALWMPALAAPPAPAPVTRTFDGWTATCNNLEACVVLATAQDDLFYVRIARAAGATAAPEVKIVLAAQDAQKGNAPAFRLTTIDGDARAALGPFPAVVDKGDPSVLSATLPSGEKSLVFIDAIRKAATLDYAVLETHGTLDLKGLSAALRFVDAAQGRQGTPTALVARGMTPVGQVPAAPDAPTVSPAPVGSVTVVDKPVVTKATSDLAEGICDPDVVKDQSDAMAWRVAGDKILVAVPCTQGAYNLASALYLTNAEGGDPKAVTLPRPAQAEADAPNVAVNAGFDPKTLELSALDKGRGLGDCGSATTWLWTGQSFALLDASGLDACPGALPQDWPSFYSAQRR